MALLQTLAPSVEPVSLSDAKTYLRLDSDLSQDDVLVGLLIGAARRYAEAYCNRSFITQKWRLTLDQWPGGLGGWNPVQLERAPVQSVDSIVYIDMSGTTQTITAPAAPAYALELTGPVGRITPGFGQIWPIPQPRIGAVQINFTAGYGPAATDVPEGIRNWMLVRIGTLYTNREEVAVMHKGSVQALPYVDQLLDPYRVTFA